MTIVYDPSDPATLRDPHAIFAQLRAEEPVHWCAKLSSWIVTSYEETTEVLTDVATYSADRFKPFQRRLPEEQRATAEEVLRWFNHWMVFRDPPEHTRLRRHMAGVLNIPVFNAQTENVEAVVNQLLDKISAGKPIDFFSQFSLWMPGMIVADLLGVERDRLLEVKQWSDDMMTFIGSSRGITDKYERARRGANAMGSYFLDLVAQRHSNPRDDVLSLLMSSRVDGQAMTDDEVVGCMMMVLNGGHETTANLLNNSMLALAANPDVIDRLRSNPGKIAAAVDEFLRYDSPVLSLGRLVTQTTELGGRTLNVGDRIFVMLVGANRDPQIFENPDRLDIDRQANPHIAFGKGPHFCLGTPLARLEGRIAINAVLQRFSKIELAEPLESIPWLNSLVTRGPTRLPVILS